MLKTYIVPCLFVFLWSTGFIGSKIVTQYAPPLTFLALRMALAAIVLVPLLFWFKSSWPVRKTHLIHAAIVGVLVHAIYLGGVFWAISMGTAAGLSALIVGLQPLLTLCLSVLFLKENLHWRKVTGIFIGLVGFTIVISERTSIGELSVTGLLLCTASLLAISAGTVYQKHITTNIDLLPSVFMQYIGAFMVLAPLALTLESTDIDFTGEFILATLWLVLVLSIGAVVLLMLLIRSEDAGNVATLFYLVPPLTAIEAYWLFGEALSPLAIGGALLCILGVALVLHHGDKVSVSDTEK